MYDEMDEVKLLVTLRYGNRFYKFVFHTFEGWEYNWEEGNYACDCNRSSFINQYCDSSFKVLDCGNLIELVEIEEL
jgi:hypothetical protein